MEESSEVHMESDVSSTTEDSQPAPEGPLAARCDLDTVIVIETDDDISPTKNKHESRTPDHNEIVKFVPKSSQELTVKKIIIKSPVNPNTKPVQKSPVKSDEAAKTLGKSPSPVKSSTLATESVVDSPNKPENKGSTDKNVDKVEQNSLTGSSENEKNISKPPNANTESKEVVPMEVASKKSPNKELVTIKISPVKDKPITITPCRDQLVKITPVKESSGKMPGKEAPIKIFLSKDLIRSSPVKDSTPKSSPAKDTKTTPTKEVQSKSTPSKEVFNKITVIKETPAKSTKDNSTKENISKETTKSTPVKETTPNKSTTKEGQAKSNAIKEPPFKIVPIKETPKPSTEPTDSEIKTDDLTLEDKEVSNDSQLETNSDTSEKEHNKSISRELRSLINSAKESKIISECTQLTSKTRKSRTPLDTSMPNLNTSIEADKIQGARRSSDNSQKSNCSEKSDKPQLKRSMRSQNPEFVSKVKNFLNSVSGKVHKPDTEAMDEDVVGKDKEEPKEKKENEEVTPVPVPKKKKADDAQVENNDKLRVDAYCWRCHWAVAPAPNEKVHAPMQCSVCPRTYHFKCLTGPERNKINLEKNWVCPECLLMLQAESSETRSPAMKKISLGMLCDLLRHALDRMMEVNGVEPFTQPVDRTAFPDYDKYVVHPMDLSLMRKHIDEGLYGSTEAFLADCQWILHNSIIFNTLQAKLTGGARALVRSCRAEMSEIEACPECYAAAHARRPTWFTDVCSTPHILLWAKLKGFPYWPAKGMSINCSGLVDVRFFGAHDRAWVPARDCFLYSEKDPNNFRTKRQDILDSMKEAEQHIRNISRKYGKFVYPPFKTQFEPTKLHEQLKLMIPSFEGEVRNAVKETTKGSPTSAAKDKSRSNSKSSKGSANDGDTSESEEPAAAPRKMADGAEIAREEDDAVTEKDKDNDKPKPMEVEIPNTKDNETTRKRRRSEMEEAVITIIDSSKEKRKRVEPEAKVEEKKDVKEIPKQDNKDTKEQSKKETSKSKETEPSTSTNSSDAKASPKVTPIRVISIAKVLKNAKISPKNTPTKEDEKTPAKLKKVEKVVNEKEKSTPQEDKKAKRRNSKNKSLNNSSAGKTDKIEKKKESDPKEKAKDSNVTNKNSTEAEKSVKDRIQFDDDTSLAVLAREARSSSSGSLPTISSVQSLSTAAGQDKSLQAASDSSVFTPTSTDNVKSMREAVNNLQKLRGKIEVRAFARMTSPSAETRPTDEVEIKTEPIDVEDSERQMQEKMDLMNAFKLRPVNPSNLREVRINKVVVTPVARKTPAPTQGPQIRPRAKKTFPQPKKADEGRSELTCKNSMVYIPIQPPATQPPPPPSARSNRPIVTTPTSTQRTVHTHNNIVNNLANHNIVNTVTSPLVPSTSTFSSPTTSTSTVSVNSNTSGAPTVGQVPTTVHTMPLITSVNGQWTFSLQPVLSVGGVDAAPSPPILNGMPERLVGVVGAGSPAMLPPSAPVAPLTLAVPAAVPSAPVPVPAQVTPAVTNNTLTSTPQSSNTPLPKLQQRPSFMNPLDVNAPVGSVPPPSTVGPLTAKLNQNAVKMTDFFRSLLEDSLEKLDEPTAQLTALKLQLEQAQWRHQQEINEIKHNHELIIAEMRSSFEKEKVRLVADTRRQTQVELDDAVKQAKSKQWCANCNQEAQFYCCWNTSYCDYPCQRAHWAQHYAVCTQQRPQDNNSGDRSSNPPESRLQQAPENLPKTTAAPNLTMATKLAPSRIYTAQDQSPKPSIIVSMVEDNSGNATMKCVGTYKPPAPVAQVGSVTMSPLIINKQLMSSEEAAKKVVTSGGYLIVGAPNSVPISSSMTMTPARRTPAIQYIS